MSLAATALWLALCVERKFVALKSSPGRSKGGYPWKVDLFRLLEILAKYGILPEGAALTDEAFNYLRNGYISLRRRELRSLDYLLSSVGRYDYVLERFCRDFPKEARRLIPPQLLVLEGSNRG